MPSFKCIKCEKTVRKNQQAIACNGCRKWTHRTCGTGISKELYLQLVNNEEEIDYWRDSCGIPDDQSSTPGTPNAESSRVSLLSEKSFAANGQISQDSILEDSMSMGRFSIVQSNALELSADSVNVLNEPIEDEAQVLTEIQNTHQVLTEESLQDDPIPAAEDIVPNQEETRYQEIDSGTQKGKRKLADSLGYAYNVKRVQKDTTYWRCSVRNKKMTCPASVVQEGEVFQVGAHQHTHAATPGISVAIEIKAKVKELAKKGHQKSGSAVVDSVMIDMLNPNAPPGTRPHHGNLIRVVNRVWESLRPKEPRTLDFDLATGYLPEGFLLKDIWMPDGERHIILATKQQLELLSRAKTWYIDGTFKVVKAPFYQLLSVHAFIRSGEQCKMVPMAFSIMSRRKAKDYIKVLGVLKNATGADLFVRIVVGDFEKALWKACHTVLDGITMRGCVFHWTQCIWRKCAGLGLHGTYQEQGAVHGVIRKVMALPFIPADAIPEQFQVLKEKAPAGPVMQLMKYVQDTWMDSGSYPIESWSVYRQPVRTNNDVEGWHHRINVKAGQQQKPLYVLIPLLHNEAKLRPIQMKLVSDGKLKRSQRKAVREVQGKLDVLWRDYREDNITAGRLLKECSKLNGPRA